MDFFVELSFKLFWEIVSGHSVLHRTEVMNILIYPYDEIFK